MFISNTKQFWPLIYSFISKTGFKYPFESDSMKQKFAKALQTSRMEYLETCS